MDRFRLTIAKNIIIFIAFTISGCNAFFSVPTRTPAPTFTKTPDSTYTPITLRSSISTYTLLFLQTISLTHTPTTLPASTGGGGKIVFSHPVEGGKYTDTYLYDFSLGKEIPLIIGSKMYVFSYSWSPDNKQIAFQDGSDLSGDRLMIVDVETGITQTLTYPTTYRNFDPSWSPDGKRIAFDSDRDNPGKDFHIFIMNVDGSNPNRLTNFNSGSPNWSPDGKKIVFGGSLGGSSGIFEININGTNLEQLTDFGDRPIWSADGKKIVFHSYTGGGDFFADDGIYIMNADGSNRMKIAEYGIDPCWSPDGSLIAFSSDRIYIMDADGNNVRVLPTILNAFYFSWSH